MGAPAPIAVSRERRYAGATAVQRRAHRKQQLLDAAADLIRAKGLSAVTYRAVCREAGLTERYFYESYPNVDALLHELFDEQLAIGTHLVVDAVAAADPTPRATAYAAIKCFVEQVASDPLLGKLLVESAVHPALRAKRRDALTAFTDLMMLTAQGMYGSPRSARAERRARHVALALAGGLNEIVTRWLDGEIPRASQREIIADTADLFATAVGAAVRSTPA